ncbi:hypothetical protein [Bradyrhizobium sp.]|nr:hypothetical protein [Bradyrhizobium sp.]
MTNNIVQFIPRPNPNREKQLEALASEIMKIALDPMQELLAPQVPKDSA